MSLKVQCYLPALRKQWGLTQEEVASLLPKGSRNRVSSVERGLVPPNAQEILSYKLIFGSSARTLFPRFWAETEDAVMRSAYRFHKRYERETSPAGMRKRELTQRMLARATGKAKRKEV